jgi:nitrite reductase/ring-hydroxylating ferredoxin subunit
MLESGIAWAIAKEESVGRPKSGASPGQRSTEYVVARASDIPEGGRLIVKLRGREIGIFNVDGRFHAIRNRCPHRGGELCKGDVLGLVSAARPGEMRLDPGTKFLVCPWHGWEFDIETGQSWYEIEGSGPSKRAQGARSYGIGVRPGAEIKEKLDLGAAELTDDVSSIIDAKAHRVMGPYKAEIYPVQLDDEYVVLTLGSTLATSEVSAAESR